MISNKFIISNFIIFLLLFSCSEKQEQSIIFTGDILLDRGVSEMFDREWNSDSYQKINDSSYHKGWKLVKSLKELFKGSDFVVGNLECPVTKQNTPVFKKFMFNAKPEYVKYLKEGGFTHLNLANNHSYDQGRSGLFNTAKNIKKLGMTVIGYGLNEEDASKPAIIKMDEADIAIFSSVRLKLENWMNLPDKPTMCQIPIAGLSENIKTFKKENPDAIVIAYLHWGLEYRISPTQKQRIEARMLIDAGADLVIGHHPHVAQIIEKYKNKKIYYSLGNFIFDQTKPKTDEGFIVKVTVKGDEILKLSEIPYKIRNCIPMKY